jgi:DNA-binding LytR/AlgR family response regulator
MNCVIVDDNKMACMAVSELVSQVNNLTSIGVCENAIDAYNILQQQKVDLMLLDIEMPGMTGIELTRSLGKKGPIIIFMTSKKEYAVEAFDLDVADYIVKPVSPARFLHAIEKAKEILRYIDGQLSPDEQEFFFVRDNGILKKISVQEILFMEAMGDYVKVFTPGKFYMVHSKLRSIEEKLPAQKFLRVHRSYIVALNKIEKIEEGVIIINANPIPVADAYRSTLNNRLNIL